MQWPSMIVRQVTVTLSEVLHSVVSAIPSSHLLTHTLSLPKPTSKVYKAFKSLGFPFRKLQMIRQRHNDITYMYLVLHYSNLV